MRRLPIFLVLDVSESMLGEPISCLQQGMLDLLKNLRADPYALETAFLSIIAFAGKVKTLVKPTEIYQFQIPELPLGAGTNVGLALNHLIDEIKNNVKTSTADKKGDFQPIVYFLSDGRATDNPQSAIERYKKEIGSKAKFIAVGIGKNADLSIFRPLTDEILRLTNTDAVDFKKFIDWVSQSITAQSQSVGAMRPVDKISLEKAKNNEAMEIVETSEAALGRDDDFLIIQGKCSKTNKVYLLKYEREINDDNHGDKPTKKWWQGGSKGEKFNFSLAVKAPEDYENWSDLGGEQNINVDLLRGYPEGCPHCGNPATICLCNCGKITCAKIEEEISCPHCKNRVSFKPDSNFKINKSMG